MIKGGQVVDLTDIIGRRQVRLQPERPRADDLRRQDLRHPAGRRHAAARLPQVDAGQGRRHAAADHRRADRRGEEADHGQRQGPVPRQRRRRRPHGRPDAVVGRAGLPHRGQHSSASTTPRAAAALGKLRELCAAKRCSSARPTDWFDASALTPGPDGDAVHRPVGLPGHQEGARRRLRRHAVARSSAASGKKSVPVGAYGSCVSAKSKDVEAAKEFAKWLWIDQTGLPGGLRARPTASTSRRARASLATGATKLEVRRRPPRRVKLADRHRPRDRPRSGPRRCATAFGDAMTNIVKKGADPARPRSPRSSKASRAQSSTERVDRAAMTTAVTGAVRPRHGTTRPREAAAARHPRTSLVLGLRRAVRHRAGRSSSTCRSCWSVYLSFFEARNTVTRPSSSGCGNYVDMLTDPAFLCSLGTFIVFAVFIVPLTFVAVARPGAAGAPGPVRAGVLPVGVLPADRVLLRRRRADLEDVDLQRRPLRPGQHRAAAGSASRRSPG